MKKAYTNDAINAGETGRVEIATGSTAVVYNPTKRVAAGQWVELEETHPDAWNHYTLHVIKQQE